LNCHNSVSKKYAEEYSDLIHEIDSSVDVVFKIAPFKNFRTKQTTAKAFELPVCSASQRMIPAIFVRSPLFGIVKRGKRRYLDNELIESWKGYKIRVRGYQFTQYDLDVLLEVFYRAINPENYRSGNYCFNYASYDFLKAIGRSGCGANYKILDNSIRLLNSSEVEFQHSGSIIYAGRMIDTYQQPVRHSKGLLGINPDIINVFEKDYVRIDLAFRQELKTDLARWKHNYISSQRGTVQNPHWMNLENIQRLSGSTDTKFRQFRMNFKKTGPSFTDILIADEVTNDIWTMIKK
ncbi:MAG: hypothetical protein GY730_05095, partial [bacterium]|nr:hypothetical protein [bacterium]